MTIPAYATATHWIGGVKHPHGEWLNGWPCCCSHPRVQRIMASGAPLTYEVAKVTCKGCIREMRKSDSLRAALEARADRKKVAKFHLQPTASFPEIAPQREEYTDDRAYDRACVKYANEWRSEYLCGGCGDVACPQCGSEGVR